MSEKVKAITKHGLSKTIDGRNVTLDRYWTFFGIVWYVCIVHPETFRLGVGISHKTKFHAYTEAIKDYNKPRYNATL